MSDARRRELERQSDDESEARLLVEAVRSGELAQADLDLAADLGDPRAGLVTGRAPRPLDALCGDLAGPRRIAVACAVAELAARAWRPDLQQDDAEGWGQRALEVKLSLLRDARDDGLFVISRERARRAGANVDDVDWSVVELHLLAAGAVGLALEAVLEDGAPRLLAGAARVLLGVFGETVVRAELGRALLRGRLAPGAVPLPIDLHDEAAFLRRRCAEGRTPRLRLELAHALGHPRAGAALHGVDDAPRPVWFEPLVTDAPFTQEVCVRALLALSRERNSLAPAIPTPCQRALRAAAGWACAPGDAAREAARSVQVLEPEDPRSLVGYTGIERRRARACLGACTSTPRGALELLLEELSTRPDDVRSPRLLAELVPWLLGYRDPLVDLLEGLYQ